MVPDARLAVATCDVTVGESRGELQVAYPLAGLAPVLDDLRRYARTPEAGSGGPATAGTEARALLSVRLAVTRLSQMELRDLAVGDVLVTDWPSNRPMSVRVDGVPQFEGTGGIFQGRKAVRISGEAAEETARADLDNPSEPVAPRWANASSCPEKRGKTPLPGANSQ